MPSKGNCCCGPPCLDSICACSIGNQYTLTIAGLANGTSGTCAALNGTHILSHIGGVFCTWRKFVVGQYLITLSDAYAVGLPASGVYLSLRVNGGFTEAAVYEIDCWDCEGSNTMRLRAGDGTFCSGYPSEIIVSKA